MATESEAATSSPGTRTPAISAPRSTSYSECSLAASAEPTTASRNSSACTASVSGQASHRSTDTSRVAVSETPPSSGVPCATGTSAVWFADGCLRLAGSITRPGVTGSAVHVGPPLEGIGSRRLIAGTLANSPENLARWITHTQVVKPGTAMPQLDVAPAGPDDAHPDAMSKATAGELNRFTATLDREGGAA